MGCRILTSRAAGQLGYRCEMTFYREVANRVHLDIPRCYFAAMNECGDGFTPALEDLVPAQPGDRIAGCSVDQARAAAVNVAGLHAPTWNDPSLRELDWLIPDFAEYPEIAAAFLVDATKQLGPGEGHARRLMGCGVPGGYIDPGAAGRGSSP